MTEREQEVIRVWNDGLSDVEIGNRPHVSTNTIKSNIHNIMERSALHQRLEVVNAASTKKAFDMMAGSISTINN